MPNFQVFEFNQPSICNICRKNKIVVDLTCDDEIECFELCETCIDAAKAALVAAREKE